MKEDNFSISLIECCKFIESVERTALSSVRQIDINKIHSIEMVSEVSRKIKFFVIEKHGGDLGFDSKMDFYFKHIANDKYFKKFLVTLGVSCDPFGDLYYRIYNNIALSKLACSLAWSYDLCDTIYGPPNKEYFYWLGARPPKEKRSANMYNHSIHACVLRILHCYLNEYGVDSPARQLEFVRDYKNKLMEIYEMAREPIFDSINNLNEFKDLRGTGVFDLQQIDKIIDRLDCMIITKRKDDTIHERVMASQLLTAFHTRKLKGTLKAVNAIMGMSMIKQVIEYRTIVRLFNTVKEKEKLKSTREEERALMKKAQFETNKRKREERYNRKNINDDFIEFMKDYDVTKDR